MIYIRGHRLDYDHWAYLGNHGWGWDDVLPLFRRSEDFDGGASELHGAGGPWHVLSRYEPDPLHASIIEAAVAAGIPRTDDHNGERIEGVCQTHFSIRDGRRDSTASAFLAPVAGHPGLTVLTGTRALRLLFEGDRCVGAEVVRDGVVEEVRATRGGGALRRRLRVAADPHAVGDRGRRRPRPPRHRRPRRPPRRRAQPPGPPARPGHLRDVAPAGRCLARPHADAEPALLAQPPRPRLPRPAAAGAQRAPLRRRRAHRARERLHARRRARPAREPRRGARCAPPTPPTRSTSTRAT